MSLILEALRKSEAERRRGRAPDLSAELPPLPARSHNRHPAWPWLGAGVALLLLAAWWLHGTRAGPDSDLSVTDPLPPPAVEAETPALPVAPAVDTPFPAIERIAPQPLPAPRAELPASTATAATAPPLPLPASAAAAPPVPSPPGRDAALSTPAPAPGARMPTVAELPAEERRQLPAMKLTMHMWNELPAQRFVILDGSRLGEGDRVGSAVITGIDVNGVVLDLNGRAVRLPLR